MNDIVAPQAVLAGAGAPAAGQPLPWTLLCVDDEPNILSALRRSLRTEN